MTEKAFNAWRLVANSPDDVYIPYVAALNNHKVGQMAVLNKPLYATADEILTAMLQVRGTRYSPVKYTMVFPPCELQPSALGCRVDFLGQVQGA